MKNTKTKSKNKLAHTLAWSLCLLLGACAPSDKNRPLSSKVEIFDLTKNTPFNIINGQDVEPTNDSFTYSIVALYNFEDIENGSLCTGSIIDDHYIITAAHCMPKDPRNLLVLFGTSTKEAYENNQFIQASDGIAHENYFKTIETAEKTQRVPNFDWGDIALVEIDQDLPPNYKPIAISDIVTPKPNADGKLVAHKETLLAGYGMFDGVKGTGSGLLRKTIVNVDNPSYSQTEASLNQTKGTGACHGDSGGPAYVKVNNSYVLWGITSRGLKDPNNDCSQYSVYTKITAYKNWVIKARKFLSTRVLPPPAPVKQKSKQAKANETQGQNLADFIPVAN